jgi:hypothetical protein
MLAHARPAVRLPAPQLLGHGLEQPVLECCKYDRTAQETLCKTNNVQAHLPSVLVSFQWAVFWVCCCCVQGTCRVPAMDESGTWCAGMIALLSCGKVMLSLHPLCPCVLSVVDMLNTIAPLATLLISSCNGQVFDGSILLSTLAIVTGHTLLARSNCRVFRPGSFQVGEFGMFGTIAFTISVFMAVLGVAGETYMKY